MRKSAAQLDREIAGALAKKGTAEIIAKRSTADGKHVLLWNDGTLTWALYNTIKGSPWPRTDAQIREALKAGWLVMGEVELYDAAEVPRLIEVARKIARRGGTPGDLRSAFAKSSPLKPHWVVQETDRDGRPTVRVWRLPRISHPGVVIWDEIRGSRGARYHVMTEVMERGRPSGTLTSTGARFKDLTSLDKYLRETSVLR